jgi:hypothetical protein
MTATTFLRVRDRLNKNGLQLELYAEPDGFRWDIANRPLPTRRVFATVHAALEHADMYTHIWYDETLEASQRLPTGPLDTGLAQSASPRSRTGGPVARKPRRGLEGLLAARRRSWNSA